MTLAQTRARAILAGLGIRATPGAVAILIAWQACEGGPADRHNPLNATLALPGSSPINSDGVQAYTSEAQGTDATTQTLTNGLYPQIVMALRDGSAAEFLGARGEISTWGTGYGCLVSALHGAPTAVPPAVTAAAKKLPPWLGWVAIGMPVGALAIDAIERGRGR